MNKKGFTTIELITSFTLASVIMIILFNIILIMKDNLSRVNAMTNTLIEKDNLSYNINKRLKDKELTSLTTCEDGDMCFLFTYSDSTSDKLVYSSTDKNITFNNYTFEIKDDMNVEVPIITEHYDTMSSTTYNGYFILNIPITIDGKDYSIKVNKYFNTDSLMIDIPKYIYDEEGNRYTIVEYLESTGTQYIDTGYGNSNGSKFNYVAAYVSDYGYIVGSHNTREPYGRQGGYYRSNNIWELGYGGSPQASFETQYNKKYEVEFSTIKGNAYLKVDGNLLISNTSTPALTSYNYLVFYNQYRLYVTHVPTTQAKIYMLQIRDKDGVLIRDYIPVIDSSSRPCLFDKVEHKCYYNQGTGEFLYG